MIGSVIFFLFLFSSKTLYVGEHEHGLYAMPSLVDEETLTIAPSSTGPLLLEGPQNFQMPTEINLDVIANRDGRGGGSAYSEDPLGIPMGDHDARGDKSSVLLFGKIADKFKHQRNRHIICSASVINCE